MEVIVIECPLCDYVQTQMPENFEKLLSTRSQFVICENCKKSFDLYNNIWATE